MKVRRAALNRIGENTIRTGAPMAHDRRAARADLHVSPLRGRRRRVDDRRPGLHLRDARRRPHAGRMGVDGEMQRKALDALSATLKPSELTIPKQDPRPDPAAAAGLRHASRAVPAHDRRRLRSDQPGIDRRRRDDRLHAAARSRRPHGGAERRRSVAARVSAK